MVLSDSNSGIRLDDIGRQSKLQKRAIQYKNKIIKIYIYHVGNLM
jgi:hypothetical protein